MRGGVHNIPGLWPIALVLAALMAGTVFARPESLCQQSSRSAAADRNKYAVIIDGAGGEPAYVKQFAQWTATLHDALVGKFGFAADRVKVLAEKPPDAATSPATAEEVRKVFAGLRTELTA